MKQFNKGKITLINKGIAEFMGAVLHKNWTNAIYTEPQDTFEFITPATEHASIHWLPEELQYHSSWDWLMPVIIKIATEIRFRTRFHLSGFPINVTICGSGGTHIAINEGNCAGEEYKGERFIADTMNLNYHLTDETMHYKPIELAWIAVAQFMEWYKKNKEV